MERPQKRHKQKSPFGSIILSKEPIDTPGLPTGVHKKSKAGAQTLERLYSCERVFCSQTLEEPQCQPQEPADRQGEKQASGPGCECEFFISYSQHYRRLPSQPEKPDIQSPGDGAGPSSWESETENFQHEGLDRAAEGNARGDPSTTPELFPEPNECNQDTKKFFPLFRPKSQWKTLHIVRHGESEYNAATMSKESFADPLVFDPKLTAKGRRQAEKLREKLVSMKISKDALWVSSPMTRALETMLLGCPQSSRIGAKERPLNIAVRRELAEQLLSTGDIGLPASFMKSAFPQFSEAMIGLPERWWFRHDENDALQKRFNKHESKAHLKVRAGEFRKWVQSRPEKVIVAFGHSCLFKELTSGQKSLRNCEVHTMSI